MGVGILQRVVPLIFSWNIQEWSKLLTTWARHERAVRYVTWEIISRDFPNLDFWKNYFRNANASYSQRVTAGFCAVVHQPDGKHPCHALTMTSHRNLHGTVSILSAPTNGIVGQGGLTSISENLLLERVLNFRKTRNAIWRHVTTKCASLGHFGCASGPLLNHVLYEETFGMCLPTLPTPF